MQQYMREGFKPDPALRTILWVFAAVMIVSDAIGLLSLFPFNDWSRVANDPGTLAAAVLAGAITVLVAVAVNMVHSNPVVSHRAGWLFGMVAFATTSVLSANTVILILDHTKNSDAAAAQNQTFNASTAARSVRSDFAAKVATATEEIAVLKTSKAVGWDGVSKLSVSAATLDCNDPVQMAELGDKARRIKREWLAFNSGTCDKIAELQSVVVQHTSEANIRNAVTSRIGTAQVARGKSLLEQLANEYTYGKYVLAGTIALVAVMMLHLLRVVVYPAAQMNLGDKKTSPFRKSLRLIIRITHIMYGVYKSWCKRDGFARMTPLDKAQQLITNWDDLPHVQRAILLAFIDAWQPQEDFTKVHAWVRDNVILPNTRIYPKQIATALETACSVGMLKIVNPEAQKNRWRYQWGSYSLTEVKKLERSTEHNTGGVLA